MGLELSLRIAAFHHGSFLYIYLVNIVFRFRCTKAWRIRFRKLAEECPRTPFAENADHLSKPALPLEADVESLIVNALIFQLLRRLFALHRKSRCRAYHSTMATVLVLLGAMCMLVAPAWLIYKPPGILQRYFQYRWPDVLWRVPTASKVVALTIDDGPSGYTAEIMQVLEANNATATFFIIGSQVEGYEETLQDLIRYGNELGNHGSYFWIDYPPAGLISGFMRLCKSPCFYSKSPAIHLSVERMILIRRP